MTRQEFEKKLSCFKRADDLLTLFSYECIKPTNL